MAETESAVQVVIAVNGGVVAFESNLPGDAVFIVDWDEYNNASMDEQYELIQQLRTLPAWAQKWFGLAELEKPFMIECPVDGPLDFSCFSTWKKVCQVFPIAALEDGKLMVDPERGQYEDDEADETMLHCACCGRDFPLPAGLAVQWREP